MYFSFSSNGGIGIFSNTNDFEFNDPLPINPVPILLKL